MARRRGNGEATFETVAGGKVRARLKVDGRRVSGPPRETRREALAALREKIRKASQPPEESAASASPSFISSLEDSIERRRARLSPTTADLYDTIARLFALDPLSGVPTREVTDADLAAWVERQPQSPGVVRRRLALLRGVLRAEGNPADAKVRGVRRHARRPLRPAERVLFMKRVEEAPPYIRAGVLLAFFTGLRRSELLGLRHEDRANGGVYLRRSVVWTSAAIVVKARLKTSESASWVPLPPQLDSVVREGARGFVVSQDETGENPTNPKTFSWWMRRLVKGTALEEVPYMGWHTLRRTYGMDLLEAGVDVVTAADAMRHDPAMLLAEYARSREDLKAAAALRAFGPRPEASGEKGGSEAGEILAKRERTLKRTLVRRKLA